VRAARLAWFLLVGTIIRIVKNKLDAIKFHSLRENTSIIVRIHHMDRNIRDQHQFSFVADDRLKVVYGMVEALDLLHDRYCARALLHGKWN